MQNLMRIGKLKRFVHRMLVILPMAVSLSTFGCHSTHQFVLEDRYRIKESQKIYKVQTTDDRSIRFDSDPLGYAILRDSTIERLKEDGTIESIPLSTIKTIHTREPDPFTTIVCIALGIGGLVMLIAWGLSGIGVG